VPLTTGSLVHACLEQILKAGPFCSKEQVRAFISDAQRTYRASIEAAGFYDSDDDVNYIATEQAFLAAGMVWGWYRTQFPKIMDEFEIVAVEQEENLEITPDIIQMSRPDWVARRRSDKALGIHDFKTSAYPVTAGTVEEYRSSVQMAVGTLGVERRLGEPVTHYYIHSLLKGGRKPFTKKERTTGPRQYSNFCYGKDTPANPPFDPVSVPELGGYWIDKTPVWDMEFPDKPENIDNAEHWVNILSEADLLEQYTIIGPYDRPDALIENYLAGVKGEEREWQEKTSFEWPWEEWHTMPFQKALFETFPPSWKCTQFGSPCQFIPICYRHPGWKDILKAGKYALRRPHHQQEREQMEEQGLEVPEE
jgi:uncharacterized protein (DUF952 family)